MKDISALPLFAKVVELNSFAEAARQLSVPTTTVSRKIQQLEQELGAKLINRSTRSLSLTELGQQVLPKAQLIADTVSELCSEAEQIANQPVGTLTITAPRALSQDLLAPMLAEFHNKYPSININLSSSNRFQDLTKQNIDFAFRLGPLHDSSLMALTLSPSNMCWVPAKASLPNMANRHTRSSFTNFHASAIMSKDTFCHGVSPKTVSMSTSANKPRLFAMISMSPRS